MNLSEMKENVKKKGLSDKIEAVLIGSCTNSSYEDISRAASIAQQALDHGIAVKCRCSCRQAPTS